MINETRHSPWNAHRLLHHSTGQQGLGWHSWSSWPMQVLVLPPLPLWTVVARLHFPASPASWQGHGAISGKGEEVMGQWSRKWYLSFGWMERMLMMQRKAEPTAGRHSDSWIVSYEEGWTLGHWTVMGVRYTFFFWVKLLGESRLFCYHN